MGKVGKSLTLDNELVVELEKISNETKVSLSRIVEECVFQQIGTVRNRLMQEKEQNEKEKQETIEKQAEQFTTVRSRERFVDNPERIFDIVKVIKFQYPEETYLGIKKRWGL